MIVKLHSHVVGGVAAALITVLLQGSHAAAQAPSATTPSAPTVASPSAPTAVSSSVPIAIPPDYVIGTEDVLSVVYWFDKELSTDVTVRPDGKISMPLLSEIQAAGLTPAQLRQLIADESKRFVQDPNVAVVVKQINSRKVFIMGEVNRAGPFPLISPTTVMQLIALAGGLKDYARSKKIVILRNQNGQLVTFPFNYKDVVSSKNLKQNIELKPGDTVIVP